MTDVPGRPEPEPDLRPLPPQLRPDPDAAARALPAGIGDGAGLLTGLFIRRPVLALVLNLLIIVAGIAAIFGAEVRELPDIDRPVVTITTTYVGASPATVDAEITDAIEGAASRVAGVKSISSTSRFGRSQVTVELDAAIDLDVAANDLRDAVARIRQNLPEEADDPRIVKADSNGDEVMRVTLTSATLPIVELTRLAEDEVVDRLAAIEGVADVQLRGDREAVLFVDIDQAALASRGLDIATVADAIAAVSGEAPAGSLTNPTQELVVRADATLRRPAQFEALMLDATTRLGDVAKVGFGPDSRNVAMRLNGETGIAFGIIRAAGSNTLEISRAVRAEVERIRAVLPPEAELGIASDDAVFVRGSIREVLVTLGISALIVIGIILVFLRSGSATLIPAVTLPVALVGTFGGIWAAGFSVNLLTLLALVLATGLVVDDAIIVLENVMRRRALGLGPRAAALAGTREVFFAVIATTATLAAVFIPISFLPGQAGGLFREFGYVLAIAVTISSVVALTLCPMLAARILPPPDTGRRRGLLGHAAAGVGNLLSGLYRRLLRGALAAPLLVVALSLLFSVSAVLLWRTVPQEVTPREDRGVVLISLTAPQGVSLDYTDAQLRKVEAVLEPIRARGDAETVFAFAGFGGPNTGFVVMTLAPWGERALSQDAIVGEIAPALAAIPGIRAFPIQPNSLGIRGGGRGLQFALAGADYASLQTLAQELVRALEATGRFQGVRLSAEPTQPQVTVAVDRERASDLGINLSGLSRAIQSVLDGRQVGTLYRDDGTTPIKLVSTGTQIDDPGDLENIFLRTASGQIVPMSSIATLSESAAPANLQRESKLRSVPVTAGLPPGFAIRDALALVEATAAGMLPPGVRIVPLAEAATLGETSRGLAVTFAIALIVVLLVLAAQFESFLSALIIMLTVPLGLACAVWAIHLSGGSLNVYSQIGLVLLVGVMAKNGILIVEFANQLRERGLGVRDAIEQASLIRVRAVVMTAISTVLGGLPLIFAEGPGAEARIALGWVVVGGLGFATLATLFLTPVCYLWIARFARPRRDEDARTAAELAAARGPARAAG